MRVVEGNALHTMEVHIPRVDTLPYQIFKEFFFQLLLVAGLRGWLHEVWNDRGNVVAVYVHIWSERNDIAAVNRFCEVFLYPISVSPINEVVYKRFRTYWGELRTHHDVQAAPLVADAKRFRVSLARCRYC